MNMTLNLDGKKSDFRKPSGQRKSMSSQQSYANSDITMGNTTIKHFSGNVSLFDDTVDEPKKKRGNGISSVISELKQVQQERGLHEGSQHTGSGKSTDKSIVGSSVQSIKQGYEKICKSPKNPIVTNSYKNSLKSPVNRQAATFRSGKVGNLAKQFESPKNAAIRKSVDPTECRNLNGDRFNINLLPPTPRRKSPQTPTTGGNGFLNELKHVQLKPVSQKRGLHSRQDETGDTASRVTVNTDAEIREAASTILDIGPPSAKTTKTKPKFGVRRLSALVSGPETVKNSDTFDSAGKKTADVDSKKKNSKKEKKKKSERFANKFKKSMEKAMTPVLNATRKVESQRISKGEF